LLSVSKLLSDEVPLKSGKPIMRRNRRGLLNVFGYGLKYLFGTADAKDVRRLNDVCDNLQSFQKTVIHTLYHNSAFFIFTYTLRLNGADERVTGGLFSETHLL
jgi:hypothetical protein